MGHHIDPTLLDELDPAARPLVRAYLDCLAAGLPGSRSVRSAIVSEVADGVIEAVRAAGESGRPAGEAAAAALGAFGDPRALAASFAREWTGTAAHRVGLGLITTGPLVGGLWVAAVTSGPGGVAPGVLIGRVRSLFTEIPLFPVLLLLVVPAAALASAGAGRASRLVPLRTRTAAAAALIATSGSVAGDLLLVATGMASHAWSAVLLLAVVMSLLRITAAAAGFRRCVRWRAAG